MPPALYVDYHDLFSQEISGFTSILEAILDNNTDLAIAISEQVNLLDEERLAEVTRISLFCYRTSNELNA